MRIRTAVCTVALCVVGSGTVVANTSAAAAKAANAKAPAAVTITGCVVRDDDSYRLMHTSGVNAPKTRSWKTAFLTRRAADVDLVDASKKLKLRDHVGHRDAVTGKVSDGDFHAQSLRHLAASCKS